MGINNSGAGAYAYDGAILGRAHDAYLYNTGGNLIIGNANNETVSQSLYLFANTTGQADMTITGSRIGIQKSGSLNATLDVNGSALISGSLNVTQGITGSLAGTASYALNAGVSKIVVSDEGTTQGTASYFDFTGAGVIVSVNNNTASVTISGGGGGGGTAIQGAYQIMTQSIAANTWSFAHNVNSRTPVVQVYDSNFNTIIPTTIWNSNPFATDIYFDVAESGYAIISTGGALAVTGSNAILNQTSAATTWSFNHNLATKYPVFTIYDNNDDVIIPFGIRAVDSSSALIYFTDARAGKAVASLGGSLTNTPSASLAVTSSYALIATSASYAFTATSASYALSSSYSRSGSYALSASYSFIGTSASFADNANNAITASFALTASYISGSNSISSSYATTSSYSKDFVIGTNGTLTFDQTLTDYSSVASSTVGPNNLFTQSTGSYTSGFYRYTVTNGTNARTGQVMAIWNAGSATYTDISTADIGNTNAVTASVSIVSAQAQFNITTNTSGWVIKSIATYM
jgi:hypothetical protein